MKPVQVDAQYLNTLLKTLVMLERKSVRGGIPPKGAQTAAARGLELRREFGRGGTMVGVARARDISNGKNLSESTVRRMKAYFDRHEVDKQGKDWDNTERPSNGKIAWLLWGGDAGRTWATMLVNRWNKEDGKKELPLWLPNGEEIESVAQLAAVLNTDTKTAAYHVLDAENPPKGLLLQAARITNTKVRRVSTPEGRRRFGQPIGTIIKDDLLPDLQMELPGMPEKPKPRKRPVIKITRDEESDNSKVEMRQLVNENGKAIPFEPMTPSTDVLGDTPDIADLPEYSTKWDEKIPSMPNLERQNNQEAILEFYDKLEKDSSWQDLTQDGRNLKANVQHNLAQRILDHAETDEELQSWTRNYIQTLFSRVPIKRYIENPYSRDIDRTDDGAKRRMTLLVDLGIIQDGNLLYDWDTNNDAGIPNIKEDMPYYDFINLTPNETGGISANNAENLKRWFPATKDREILAKYSVLSSMNYIDGSSDFRKWDKHSTESLIYLWETKQQIQTWAGTSGDTNPESVAFQMDVQEAFNLEDAVTSHMNANTDSVEHLSVFRKTLIRAMYQETQEFFKDNKITHVEGYRGMYFDRLDDVPEWLKDSPEFQKAIEEVDIKIETRREAYVQDYVSENWVDSEYEEFALNNYIRTKKVGVIDNKEYKKWLKENEDYVKDLYTKELEYYGGENWMGDYARDEISSEARGESFSKIKMLDNDIEMQPISSWSIDIDQAKSFSDNGVYKVLLKTVVPVELIFSTAFTGNGCLSEYEIVILGGKGKADIQWSPEITPRAEIEVPEGVVV